MKSAILSVILCMPILAQEEPILADTSQEPENHDAFDKEIYNWTKTLSEAFHLMKTKYYVKKFDIQDAMSNCIDSFVSQDPHSSFMNPKSYKDIIDSTNGEFFGIGVVISTNKAPEEEFLPILDTVPDGPADHAGLVQGDKIIEIDGLALRGMTSDEATAKLKGERNSKVHLKVIRDGYAEPLKFDITRDVVKDQNSLCYHFKDNDVYYIHLAMFTQNAPQQIEALLQKAQKKSCKGIILDLRNNSGGLLPSAVDLAGIFIDKGSVVVTTRDRNNTIQETFSTTRDPINISGIPLFVLVNNYTASAAEILAGCLQTYADRIAQQSKNKKQDRLLVFLVGTTTFGKGSVQEVIPVSNDCAVKITTSLYFLPNNITIQGVGITPDITIDSKLPPTEQMVWVNKHYGRESALKHSIKTNAQEKDAQKKSKNTGEEKTEKKSTKERRKEMIMRDSQIQDTLTCINILNLNPQAWNARTDAIKLLKKTFVNGNELVLEEVKA
ncbi:S41 family peptidase [Candidatus Babeliales bacterium]|nr:S41 family peptidase [Candidatus Babeliales bacterium]